MALTKVPNELSSTPSIVDGGNATAITITSDEDLLVAKGSLDVATVGHELRASGYSAATRDGATVGSFTRLNSNGSILEFRQDSTNRGVIGTVANDLFIASADSGHNGLRFHANGILPTNNAGAIVDADADLGVSTHRFKDLYLSGGAYLGGTAAVNKLDDYEVGTWSPSIQRQNGSTPATFTVTAGSARYTKIGNTVHLMATISGISNGSSNGSNYWVIYGVPFATQVIQYAGAALAYNSTGAESAYVGDAGGNAILSAGAAVYSGSLSGAFMLNLTYKVT